MSDEEIDRALSASMIRCDACGYASGEFDGGAAAHLRDLAEAVAQELIGEFYSADADHYITKHGIEKQLSNAAYDAMRRCIEEMRS